MSAVSWANVDGFKKFKILVVHLDLMKENDEKTLIFACFLWFLITRKLPITINQWMNIITLKSSLWWRTLSLPHIPQVDIYISRDLDSQFSDREEAAVKEWLTSNKSFHFMRDHPSHGTHILGMLLNNRESTKKLPGPVIGTV